MARQLVTLALVLFAIVGLATAAVSPAVAPSNDVIGNTDSGSGPDDVEEGFIGGPVPDGVFAPESAVVDAPKSSNAAIVKVSAGVAAAVVAVALF